MPRPGTKMLETTRATVTEGTLDEAVSTLKKRLHVKDQEITQWQERHEQMENRLLGMERRLAAYGCEKIATITLPVTGAPNIDLEGPWTNGDFRKIHAVFFAAIREKQHRDRIERTRNLEKPVDNKTAGADARLKTVMALE
mgnify:CR=1 FL=1